MTENTGPRIKGFHPAFAVAFAFFGFCLLLASWWRWCCNKVDIRILSKHSPTRPAYAEIILLAADIILLGTEIIPNLGKDYGRFVGLKMEAEGSCPIQILWSPDKIEGGLRYEIPLPAPCLTNHFNWTIEHPTGTLTELSTILEGQSKSELKSSDFAPEHVSNVRQAGTQMLRWTRSPCADKYVVRVEGDPTQQFVTEENWINLNTFDTCEEVLVVVKAHSGEQSSLPSVPAPFNPCANEKDLDGELASWMKKNLIISQREQGKPKCL